MQALIDGLILGTLISIPIGPLALLCLQRTWQRGLRHGLISALGISTADLGHTLLAHFGLSLLIASSAFGETTLSILAALLLIAVGVASLWAAPHGGSGGASENREVQEPTLQQPPRQRGSNTTLVYDFGSTLVIAAVHPSTLVVIVAVLGATGRSGLASDAASVAWVLLGMLLASITIWTVFCSLAFLIGRGFSEQVQIWAGTCIGLILATSGTFLLLNGLSGACS